MINGCNNENRDKIINLINSVKQVDVISDEIINNSLYYEENGSVAMISYELFNGYALIRYFIFKKNIEENIIFELMNELIKRTYKNKMKGLIAISSDEMLDLFKKLDFVEFDKKYFFIEETPINSTKYKNSNILLRNISSYID